METSGTLAASSESSWEYPFFCCAAASHACAHSASGFSAGLAFVNVVSAPPTIKRHHR
ncbi:hypothetical protein ANCCAN_18032 [Ancylostoma caninum]|uniref:Uncharacterized protein n=1 Tax=Ancylostoma caninum TaxID=29170 RepID=A0A368G0I8_ANCCA|nr:hypothetical protein ANCCAN_18032 [Ancylostoma caninum]